MAMKLVYLIESGSMDIIVSYNEQANTIHIRQDDDLISVPADVVGELRTALKELAYDLADNEVPVLDRSRYPAFIIDETHRFLDPDLQCGKTRKYGDIVIHRETCKPRGRLRFNWNEGENPCVLMNNHPGDHKDEDGDMWRDKESDK